MMMSVNSIMFEWFTASATTLKYQTSTYPIFKYDRKTLDRIMQAGTCA